MTTRLVPTHIVVDTRDGYIFGRDSFGTPFTHEIANRFAAVRNSELRQGNPFQVFQLVSTV